MASTKKINKLKLEEMSVEDFLDNGIDSSDVEEVEETKPAMRKKKTSKRIKDKTSIAEKHKLSLDKLKKSDPEFYQFLQENDEELLNFDPNDLSSDEDDPIHKLPSTLQEASDDSEDEAEVLEEKKKSSKLSRNRGKPVTLNMISKWRQSLKESHSLKTFHEVTRAFKAAVKETNTEKEKKAFAKYRVEGSEVFNALITLCVRHVASTLHHALDLHETNDKKLLRPSTSKRWKNVQDDVKLYMNDLIKLTNQVTEPSVVAVILRHINVMIPYASCFSKVATALIKKLVNIWSTGEESVRVLAFLSLFKITRYMSKTRLEFILKQMYLAFVRNSKFTSVTTLPLINFMQRSLTEMFAINVAATYQHGFVYIRQLAIHLRNAITVKEKDTYQSVYNWQYIHCLTLWCRVLGTIQPCDSLRPLIYPLVQTAVGVIKLIPSERYYPLRFHLVRALNQLSEMTGAFIPLSPFIMEVLEQTKFNKKNAGVSIKPINFAVILKLSKQQLNERAFRDGVIEQVCDLLLDHMQIHSYSIGFPELALPAIIQLKSFLKTCKVTNHSKPIKQILEKIQENVVMVTKKRDSVAFSIADGQAVAKWENVLKEQSTPIMKHYVVYKRRRQQELLTEEAGKDRLIDDDIPIVQRNKKQKTEDRVEFKDLFNSDSDSDDDILERAEKKRQRDRAQGRARCDSDSDLSDLDLEDFGSSASEDAESSDDEEEKDRTQQKMAVKDKKGKNLKKQTIEIKKSSMPTNDDDPGDVIEDFHFSSESEEER